MLNMSEWVREKKGGTRASQSGKQTAQRYGIKEAGRAKQTSAISVRREGMGPARWKGLAGAGLEKALNAGILLLGSASGQPRKDCARLTLHRSLSEQRYQERIPGSGPGPARASPTALCASRAQNRQHCASQHSLAPSRRKVVVDYVKGSDLLPGKRR